MATPLSAATLTDTAPDRHRPKRIVVLRCKVTSDALIGTMPQPEEHLMARTEVDMKRDTLIALVGGILGGFGGAAVWGQYAMAQDAPLPVVCEAAGSQRNNLTATMQRLRDSGYTEFLMVPRSGDDARRGTVCAW